MAADENFLSRWSRRKSDARTGAAQEPPAQPVAEGEAESAPSPAGAPAQSVPAPLPPVESLTPESDFTPFMKPEVDEGLKRQALKTLFADARFNVMDRLDVYIDDYSIPDPIPESWLGQLNQLARLGHYQEKKEEEPPSPERAGDGGEGAKDPEQSRVIASAPPVESDTSDAGERGPEI